MFAMDTKEDEFHLEEYKQIRTEVAGLLTRIEQLFRYSILVSATVFAWLLSTTLGAETLSDACLKVPQIFAKFAILIPSTFILIAGVMALIAVLRVSQMGRYLRVLEQLLGRRNLGWEGFMFHKPKTLTYSTGAIWIVLFGLACTASFYGYDAIDKAKDVCKTENSNANPFAQADPLRHAAKGPQFSSGPLATHCNGPVGSNVRP
jgi:hypothetical protein